MAADCVGKEACGKVDFVKEADVRQQGRRSFGPPCVPTPSSARPGRVEGFFREIRSSFHSTRVPVRRISSCSHPVETLCAGLRIEAGCLCGNRRVSARLDSRQSFVQSHRWGSTAAERRRVCCTHSVCRTGCRCSSCCTGTRSCRNGLQCCVRPGSAGSHRRMASPLLQRQMTRHRGGRF
jgi:hypothetical protein